MTDPIYLSSLPSSDAPTDSGGSAESPRRKSKQPRYELTKDQKSLIKADSVNNKLWDELLASAKEEGTVRPLMANTHTVVDCCSPKMFSVL